jgi:hypothetical protein
MLPQDKLAGMNRRVVARTCAVARYRLIVQRDGDRVIGRDGCDWTKRYPLIVEAGSRTGLDFQRNCTAFGQL